jgi:hypothetical protein
VLGTEAGAAEQQQSAEALRVFSECSGRDCNFTYYRTEIPWVNWVRDRTVAQVHLIMTSERNASGGSEYSFDFIGQEDLEGEDDLLTYVSLGTALSSGATLPAPALGRLTRAASGVVVSR